jgi:hypothetical protein
MLNSDKMVTCTFCRIKGFKHISLRMHIQEMEEGEGASSHDKEAEGQNIRVGNAETESNGHKGRGEQETLIETVRSLKIEVQSYKEDNERLMREKSQINSQCCRA